MLLATLFLFLFNSVIGSNYEELKPSIVQADFYLQEIRDNGISPEKFWLINELSSSHPIIESYIQDSLSDIVKENNCLLSPLLTNKYPGSPQKEKISRLRQAFECSNDNQLYIALLHEMPRQEAYDYYNIVKPTHLTAYHQEHINKALGKDHNIENLFLQRDFQLSDVYLFHRISFTSEEEEIILAYLDRELKQFTSHRNNTTWHHLMLATFANGYSRLYQDELVYNTLRLFENDHTLPNSRFKLNLFKRIGFSTYFTGNYRDALHFYRDKLIPLSKLIDEREEQLTIKLDYGSMLFRLGNLRMALEQYELVYNDPVEIQNSRYRSVMMNNLAVAYLNSGDFNSYLQFQLDALDESIKAGFTGDKLHYLNNLYIYYRRNEDWASALTYLNEAAQIAYETGSKEELTSINVSLGTYERDRNQDYEAALSYLRSAEVLASKTGNYRLLLFTKTELYKTYLVLSEVEKAQDIMYSLIDITVTGEDKHSWLDVHAQIAELYLRLDMLDEVLPIIKVLESESYEEYSFITLVRSTTAQARFYFMKGNPIKALSIVQTYSDEILERVKNSTDYQSGFLRMDIEFIEHFSLLTDLLLHLDRPKEALTLLDELKNISRFSFYNNPALKASILNEEELIYDFALSNRIERLRNELHVAPVEAKVGINNQITQALAEKSKLKSRVLGDVDNSLFDFPEVQNKLEQNELILHYTFFHQQMFLATISSDDVSFITKSFSDEDMRRFEQAIHNLSNGDTDLLELSWIHGNVLPAHIPNQIDKLIVVPDGFLYRLPLEVLPTSYVNSPFSYGSARYLIEDYAITYVNSLKDFEDAGRTTRNHDIDFLGFGISNFEGFHSNLDHNTPLSALPFAEKEIREIKNTLTRLPQRVSFLSNKGTEQALRENAGRSRVIHIASHSEVFHPDPLYSVIYMHGSDESDYQNDGLVYAYELFDMDLSTDMVMLSSCESGSGSYIQGSGIVGLSRAFSYAGAQSLIMNLWSIQDETASSMAVSFYEYLNQGLSKDEAMRQAKINYINDHNSNPYLWGSFVVYGDNSPLVYRPYSVYWWVLALGIIAVGIMITFKRYKAVNGLS